MADEGLWWAGQCGQQRHRPAAAEVAPQLRGATRGVGAAPVDAPQQHSACGVWAAGEGALGDKPACERCLPCGDELELFACQVLLELDIGAVCKAAQAREVGSGVNLRGCWQCVQRSMS